MWDFNHPPLAAPLSARYNLTLTAPAECARAVLAGRADLGLIPIAALTPQLRVVPGCTIASLHTVRSIQLIVKAPRTLTQVRTVAADTASRSSVAYTQILFKHFHSVDPQFHEAPADAVTMLANHDAALLIGDPALLALERRAEIEAAIGPCTWYDIAEQWNAATGLPWVAAVWAVRPEAVPTAQDRTALIADLQHSRDSGLQHISQLVQEWTPRIALPPATIHTYFTRNIHYVLDSRCFEAITLFRTLAAQHNILPPLPELPLLKL